MANKLIAFYSGADENYVNGQIKTLAVGNTEIAAEIIHELTAEEMAKLEALDEEKSLFFSHQDPETVAWFMSIL